MFSRHSKAVEQRLFDSHVTSGAPSQGSMHRWIHAITASRQGNSPVSESVRRPRYPSCIGRYSWRLEDASNCNW